jgi:peptidoglycan hydrolase-like protein with peptidoglycan-binding domain
MRKNHATMAKLRALTGALLLSVVVAAPAAAQTPIPTPPPAAPTPPPAPTPAPPAPAPTPPPAPATGQLAVKATTAFKDGRDVLALRGKRFRVTGTLAPFVAGQTATVEVKRGKQVIAKRKVRIRQAGANGAFKARFTLRDTGAVRIYAVHRGTAQLAAAKSQVARVTVLRPSVGPGDRGASVRMLQRGLNRLRYAAGTSGRYDDATGRAILAWRKVNGRSRVYSADSGMYGAVLRGKGAWKVRHPKAGKHVEAILAKQAFALIDAKGNVVRVLPTSSGAPATPTILGHYRFYRKDLGTNALGMVDAAYFIRGYAIHGYHDVPTYNASHGCLRISNASARYVHDWVDIGDDIFVSAT